MTLRGVRRALPILLTLATGFGLWSCTGDDLELTEGCEFLQDCPLGEVCQQPEGICVPEPESGVLGDFQCIQGTSQEDAQNLARDWVANPDDLTPVLSQVRGSIGQNPVALVGDALCWVENGDFNVVVKDSDLASVGYLLQVTVNDAELSSTEFVELIPASSASFQIAVDGLTETFVEFGVANGSVLIEERYDEGGRTGVFGYLEALDFAQCPAVDGIPDCTDVEPTQ